MKVDQAGLELRLGCWTPKSRCQDGERGVQGVPVLRTNRGCPADLRWMLPLVKSCWMMGSCRGERVHTQKPAALGDNPSSVTHKLCGLRPVTSHLWAAVSLAAK